LAPALEPIWPALVERHTLRAQTWRFADERSKDGWRQGR
jgi:hypothetical protein